MNNLPEVVSSDANESLLVRPWTSYLVGAAVAAALSSQIYSAVMSQEKPTVYFSNSITAPKEPRNPRAQIFYTRR